MKVEKSLEFHFEIFFAESAFFFFFKIPIFFFFLKSCWEKKWEIFPKKKKVGNSHLEFPGHGHDLVVGRVVFVAVGKHQPNVGREFLSVPVLPAFQLGLKTGKKHPNLGNSERIFHGLVGSGFLAFVSVKKSGFGGKKSLFYGQKKIGFGKK